MKGFAYLLKLEADQNHNRYYRMVQEGDRFKIEMGRIGARPVCMIRPMTLWDTTYQKKIKEGYEDRSEFCDVSVEKNQNYKPIPESVVAELMEYLQKEANQILEKSYTISWTDVNEHMLKDAQSLINQIGGSVEGCNQILLKLFVVIPRKMQDVQEMLAHTHKEIPEIIQREQDLLDVLRFKCKQNVQKGKTATPSETILDALGITIRECTYGENQQILKHLGKESQKYFKRAFRVQNIQTERPRNKEKGKEEDFFEIIKLIPDYMDMRFFMPNNMDQFYFKSEMKTKGIVSCEKFRKAQITDKQINEIEDVGFFMQLIDPKKHSAFILIPSKNFFTPFCRKLGIGKVNYGIDPIRDIYLASRLKDANPFVIVYRTNDPATYGKAFTCFSEKTVKIEQSCIFDYKDALAKIEPNIIRSWQYTHTRTDIDFSYPARSINLKQKCKITLGTRLSFSDIGECAFRLQNCIFTNGGTILLPQEASRKKSNKLSPEGIVKDYNSQCYMKFDKIMEQLKSYETIPVTDMQQSVWNILEKLKFSSAFGFSNTRDLQKNYLSTFEKEGDALDVVIKILKIPGVLQRNYPGTTHDRVNECIGKIFNLKMEKLIV